MGSFKKGVLGLAALSGIVISYWVKGGGPAAAAVNFSDDPAALMIGGGVGGGGGDGNGVLLNEGNWEKAY